ncbi:translocase of chloroplast 101, chloroplastic-like [Phragmites australis]|uniref:translocase of chloroplast 101, chloroplastic-like n=1 Tax=Phragmites australis TaxID=29695 RepID=UPI002D79091F|nr:translocase of chloroplast 101, chloroplastic-like [Phragmites australis]XP_062214052.1 translocase of chloroplast 101, chloroplastic-like [Phragmites australis]
MALLVRARLSSLDDDDAATSSSLSSAASSPPLSPSPPAAAAPSLPLRARAAVLGAPRVAAQLSSTDEDGSEAFDDATSYGEDGEFVEEVSNGFFFSVAKVPPAAAEDPSLVPVPGDMPTGGAAASESGNSGTVEGSLEESFMSARSVFEVLNAGTRSGLDGVVADGKGTGVEGSLDGRFQSSTSIVGALDDGEAAASGDLVNVSDDPVLKDDKQGGQDVGAEALSDVVPEPFMADAGGIDGVDMRIVDALEGEGGGSDHDVAELPAVANATEEEDAGVELRNNDSDVKDSTTKHEVVTNVEDASPEYVDTRDGTFEPVEVRDNADGPYSIADGGHSKVDEKTGGDHEASDDSASMPISGGDDAGELLEKELEDNVPASKGTHFGVDDSNEDEEEMNGKEIEFLDYAALAELLWAANRSPGQGNAKVFPVETSEPRNLPPTVVSIPRTDVVSTPVLEVAADPENEMTDEEKKLYRKVDMARIKYLRLIHRLGYDTDHQVPVQVLYRFSLVEGFRRLRIANHSSELENAWKRALRLEAEGIENLEFSCNVLVLGKTGVGKSATINSIFGEDKSKTNAFLPATSSVKEISGVVDGVKFRVIDTPGLGTSAMDEKSNRKVLNSVKRYMNRCPPDIILYVDRIDTLRQDENSLSLLRGITTVLGLSIWSKTIITLTNSAAAPPEGPSGSAMNYEMVVTRRTHAIQQSIRQATNDPRIENPVALVENHHLCRRNTEGEKVLPNGLVWRRLLLLLCYSLKMVAEIDSLSTRRAASAGLFGRYLKVPPLPYFVSSLLQSREHPRHANDQNLESVESDVDLDELLNEDQGDGEEDYDPLPPFKPLSKSQIAKLSKEQQKLYFDEYDYRTELLQKKQLKERLRRFKEMKKREGNNHDVPADDDRPDDEYDTDRSPMPDWGLPSSFDSDDPVYRYRCLEPTPNLLVRAVTNPDGWDHDCGFDGVNLQYNLEVANKFPASLWVQAHKDKREFTIHLDSSMSAKHGDYGSTLAGFDIQTMMDQFAYTLRGETKLKNFKKNITTGGLSMTFLGNTMVTGAKFEDKLSVGNRLTLVANTGAVSMRGDTAYGVNMEAILREKNYPVGQGLATLGASLVRWRKEWTMAANLDSQFSVGRTSNMAVHVDVNNKLTGRVSIKANTSEQLKIALLGICSATMYLWNRMHPGADPNSE